MNIEEKITIIKRFSLFDSLNDQELTFIAQNAKQLVFSPHKTIISQDKSGEGVYAIYKGLIRVFIISQEGKVIPIKIKRDPYVIGIVDVIDMYGKIVIIEAMQGKTVKINVDNLTPGLYCILVNGKYCNKFIKQ